MFKERNPDFNGTVSIYGHSLGSVIAYDISSHQLNRSPVEIDTKACASSARPASVEVDISDLLASIDISNIKPGGLLADSIDIDAEKLEFDIDQLFCVGSPVGMFLLLGGNCIRPVIPDEKEDPNMKASRPAVRALYNIFHPYDPVAQRMEPLFSQKFSTLKPTPIHYTKGGLTV